LWNQLKLTIFHVRKRYHIIENKSGRNIFVPFSSLHGIFCLLAKLLASFSSLYALAS
jgi:hypothetical protein